MQNVCMFLLAETQSLLDLNAQKMAGIKKLQKDNPSL